jgi:hypothetical protein
MPWLHQKLGVVVLPPMTDRVRPFACYSGTRPIVLVGFLLAFLCFRLRPAEFVMRLTERRKTPKPEAEDQLRKFYPRRPARRRDKRVFPKASACGARASGRPMEPLVAPGAGIAPVLPSAAPASAEGGRRPAPSRARASAALMPLNRSRARAKASNVSASRLSRHTLTASSRMRQPARAISKSVGVALTASISDCALTEAMERPTASTSCAPRVLTAFNGQRLSVPGIRRAMTGALGLDRELCRIER